MNKILTKEEIEEIYKKLTDEEIESLKYIIKISHSHWQIKRKEPSKREIVDWWRMKQRAIQDPESEK